MAKAKIMQRLIYLERRYFTFPSAHYVFFLFQTARTQSQNLLTISTALVL